MLAVVLVKGMPIRQFESPYPSVGFCIQLTCERVPWVAGAQTLAGNAIAATLVLCLLAYLSTAVVLSRRAIGRGDPASLARLLGPIVLVLAITAEPITQVLMDGNALASLHRLVQAPDDMKVFQILLFQMNQPITLLAVLEPVAFWVGILLTVMISARWFRTALRADAGQSVVLKVHVLLGALGTLAMAVAAVALAVQLAGTVQVDRAPAGPFGLPFAYGAATVSSAIGLVLLVAAVLVAGRRSWSALRAWRSLAPGFDRVVNA